jgi:aryl-alcohol dehydrogenase-like predicted oxidoreductase
MSAARRIAGAALGLEVAEPLAVSGTAVFGATGVDEWAVGTLGFPGGILATVAAGVRTAAANEVVVSGSGGVMRIADPWTPSRWSRDPVRIAISGEGGTREVLVPGPKHLYGYEVDVVGASLARGQAPAMTWADSLGNMRALDRWRQAVGMVYASERSLPASRSAPAPAAARMRHGRIDGIGKPVSRLVMGADTNHTLTDTALLFDDYLARGGNAFDTSHHYGWPRGACERNLGRWIRERGIRDQVVVIEKGGNPPNGTPAGLAVELAEGLERLDMERVDIYMLHRDNEQVPIGEWVEALNRHLDAGRMTVFGLSNFSLPRLRAFDAYARAKGLRSFAMVSNQFSLARMLDAPWPGLHLVSSSDEESRAWFAETRTPLMSWSSQARGFFSSRAARADRSDADLVRCWYSDDNFARKERAEALARRRGVEPTAIALAYVLAQPFPTFPLIGPKRPGETRRSLEALAVELTAEESRWLRTGEGAAAAAG